MEDDERLLQLEVPTISEVIRRVNFFARATAGLAYEAESIVLRPAGSREHIHVEPENDRLIIRPCTEAECDLSAQAKHVLYGCTVLSTPCEN